MCLRSVSPSLYKKFSLLVAEPKSRACGIHTNRGMRVILCYSSMNNSLTVYCSLYYSCISSIKLPALYY